MRSISSARIRIIIVLGALMLFVPGLGAVHLFDWDEINFAEIAREMLATGDWLRPRINYEAFYEKPPLFMWMQAVCMSIFGVGEFAARLPNAICGALTLLTLFRIGSRLRGQLFGLLWMLAYVGSILPNLYFRSGLIDPWFNLFIFLSLDAFISSKQNSTSRDAILCGLWLGLAILIKGPVAALVVGLVVGVYWISTRFRRIASIPKLFFLFATMLVIICSWAVIDISRNGPAFITAFFQRQVAMLTTEDAGHGGFFGYHFVVLLVGCFPASLFAIHEMLKPSRSDEQANDHRRWMVMLFWVVLILFTIVKTKIVHYSSLCYFPLTYLAALQLERLWNDCAKPALWMRIGLGVVGHLFVLAAIALPWLGMHPEKLKPLLNDAFAQANLAAQVHWGGNEAFAGIWLLVMLAAAHLLFQRERYRKGILVLFAGSALFVTKILYYDIRKIEHYTQRAAIGFWQAHANERCYVTTIGYKSYAHLFYARVAPDADPRANDDNWLLHGNIDRPVYLACKITDASGLRAEPRLVELYDENGFVFFRRDP